MADDPPRSSRPSDTPRDAPPTTEPRHPDEQTEAVLEFDSVFAALAHARRRYLLYTLVHGNRTEPLPELADKIAAWEQDKPRTGVSDEERRHVHASLYHAYIPKLAALDILAYHQDEDIIVEAQNTAKVQAVLDGAGAELDARQEAHAWDIRGQTIDDVRRAHEKGKDTLIPAMESSMMIENELDRIDVLHGLGVRLMGITYSDSNALGTGLGDMRPNDGGLTNFGREAVERMNRIGMAVSVSHSSEQTALDVYEVSDDPVLLTHDGARALNGIDRLKPDKCLTAVADTGGVIGVQAAPHGTFSEDHPRHSVESVMDHFEYLVDLVGIDHVTFGTDTLYGDHRALHRLFGSGVPENAEEVEYVEGMENPTEAWQNVVRWLVKNDYSEDEIRKVLGENTLRVLEEVWP